MRRRCLSLRQPWLWAVFFAGKDVENRVWSTSHRGELFFHAASGCTKREYESAVLWMVNRGLARAPASLDMNNPGAANLPQVPELDDLPRGVLFGRVDLWDVITPGGATLHRWHMPEQHGFRIRDAQALAESIPMKAWQRIFYLPDDIAARATEMARG